MAHCNLEAILSFHCLEYVYTRKKVTLKTNFMRWEGPWLKPKVDQSVGTHTMVTEMWRPSARLLWFLVHARPCSPTHPHGEDKADPEAKLAKLAECYNNMPLYGDCDRVGHQTKLSNERNLLSAAYKNVVVATVLPGGSSRVLSIKSTLLTSYIWFRTIERKWESKLRSICTTMVESLGKYLIANTTNSESKVFYLKLKGGYFWYLAEVAWGDDRKQMILPKVLIWGFWYKEERDATHTPNSFGAGSFKFSVLYYETLNNPELACTLAKMAFDEATTELDTMNEDLHKDSYLYHEVA